MEPTNVLIGLTRIARDWAPLAIVWHVLLVALIAAVLAGGWRMQTRAARGLLAIPLVSVSAMAWLHGNPFNGTIFALLAVALVAIGGMRAARATTWAIVLGVAMIAFGAWYPHFLEDRSPLAYLVAAPMGLLPCPTLAVLMGIMLAGGGLGSRAASRVLAGAGLFYGVFGVLVLGVTLDIVLVAGALGLALASVDQLPARALAGLRK